MDECLNIKEKVLLEYICTRYKNTLEVKFRIPINAYSEIGIKTDEELDQLLGALHIRGYIQANEYTKENRMHLSSVTLTEKALNIFNAQ